jgi:hypothetical protein
MSYPNTYHFFLTLFKNKNKFLLPILHSSGEICYCIYIHLASRRKLEVFTNCFRVMGLVQDLFFYLSNITSICDFPNIFRDNGLPILLREESQDSLLTTETLWPMGFYCFYQHKVFLPVSVQGYNHIYNFQEYWYTQHYKDKHFHKHIHLHLKRNISDKK